MELEKERCYRIIKGRDRRYDGLFYTGVKTTGIYCRPVCPARTPKIENVIFLKSAAEAQAEGFRPCKRCRPELAPESFLGLETTGVLRRALELIGAGYLNQARFSDLAVELEVSERHLRRLFRRHLGATPSSVAQTQRLALARRLLEETELSLTDLAFASGFSSVRQFNEVFRKVYQRPPTALRERPTRSQGLVLRLGFRPPLDWTGLLEFLKPRLTPGLEALEGNTYRRSHGRLTVEVSPESDFLRVRILGPVSSERVAEAVQGVTRRVRSLFDLDLDPTAVARTLGPQVEGLRVPGFWDPFELVVRTILGQQVSVAAATTLCGRLVQAYGGKGRFPSAQQLSRAPLEEQGLTGARAETLRELSRRVLQGLYLGPGFNSEKLLAIPGIGPWTVAYLGMRLGREPDAFPSGDLGLRRSLGGISSRELEQRSQGWKPWRAYAAMAIWKGILCNTK